MLDYRSVIHSLNKSCFNKTTTPHQTFPYQLTILLTNSTSSQKSHSPKDRKSTSSSNHHLPSLGILRLPGPWLARSSINSHIRFGKLQISLPKTNISHPRVVGKMSFLFPCWDMLAPWRVFQLQPGKPILAEFFFG